MELSPQLPPLPTLTLNSTQLNAPPEEPPDPLISMLFLENTEYRAPNNPFRGSLLKVRNREHKEALQEALKGIRASFLFSTERVLEFDGACVGVSASADDFTAAVTLVIAAIERGYYSSRDPTPLVGMHTVPYYGYVRSVGRSLDRNGTPVHRLSTSVRGALNGDGVGLKTAV